MKNSVLDSPQDSLVGRVPSPKGSDMGPMRRHKEPVVGDPQTPAAIDTTFYADVPTHANADPVTNSPELDGIYNKKDPNAGK